MTDHGGAASPRTEVLAAYLHRKGIGCDGHRGDDADQQAAMHRDDALDILGHLAEAAQEAPAPEGPRAALLALVEPLYSTHERAVEGVDRWLRVLDVAGWTLVPRAEAHPPEGLDALAGRLVNAMLAVDAERPGGAYPHLGRESDVRRFAADLADRLAQEAPAPEGLRDAALDLLAALRSWEQSWQTSGEGYGGVRKAKIALARLATPPTPAEPPRPYDPAHPVLADHPETQWNDLDERTRRPRSEARPPEGLDAAWSEVKAALPHGGFYVSLTETYRGWTATARPKIGKPITESKMPTARVALHRLAARLSGGGAE